MGFDIAPELNPALLKMKRLGTAYHAGTRADAACGAGKGKFGIPLSGLGFEHLKLQYVSHFSLLEFFNIENRRWGPFWKLAKRVPYSNAAKWKVRGPWRDMSGSRNRLFGNGHVVKKSMTYTAPNH
jgi:hypothetical protein